MKQSQVESWLNDAGITSHREGAAIEGAGWHIEFDYPQTVQAAMHVFRLKHAEQIVIQRGTAVADIHRRALRALEAAAFREFYFEMVRDLLLSGVEYSMDVDGQDLIAFHVARKLHVEDARPTAFMDAVQSVVNGAMLGTIHVRRAIGDEG